MAIKVKVLLVTVFCWVLTCSALEAGIAVTGTQEIEGKTGRMNLYLEADRLCLDFQAGEEDARLIFREEKQTLWLIDKQKNSAVKITRDDLQKIQRMMAWVKEQLQALPPEQRVMLESQMRQQLSLPADQQELEYRLVATGEPVGPWSTDRYEVTASGQKTAEVWTVAWNNLEVEASDFQALEGLTAFMELIAEQLPLTLPIPSKEPLDYEGFPVKAVHYRQDTPRYRMEITEITRRELAEELFALPADMTIERLEIPEVE